MPSTPRSQPSASSSRLSPVATANAEAPPTPNSQPSGSAVSPTPPSQPNSSSTSTVPSASNGENPAVNAHASGSGSRKARPAHHTPEVEPIEVIEIKDEPDIKHEFEDWAGASRRSAQCYPGCGTCFERGYRHFAHERLSYMLHEAEERNAELMAELEELRRTRVADKDRIIELLERRQNESRGVVRV